LTELANKLISTYSIKVLTLAFDVRDKDAVAKAISTLTEEWKKD